jgi:hypothetical protein
MPPVLRGTWQHRPRPGVSRDLPYSSITVTESPKKFVT